MSLKKIGFLESVAQREFDPRETMQWLRAQPIWMMSWGSRNFMNYENKAFYFNVSGRKHNGIVLITLAWDDTYTVRLMSTQWNEKKVFEQVYCDSLAELIDINVERIKEYTS